MILEIHHFNFESIVTFLFFRSKRYYILVDFVHRWRPSTPSIYPCRCWLRCLCFFFRVDCFSLARNRSELLGVLVFIEVKHALSFVHTEFTNKGLPLGLGSLSILCRWHGIDLNHCISLSNRYNACLMVPTLTAITPSMGLNVWKVFRDCI